MPIKLNLDQWANGFAPDAAVTSGSQNDQWQNGNLGSSQAHYNEGEFVPYRISFSGLTVGATYTVTIAWDTTQGGKHALDYIGSWDESYPASRTSETFPTPTIGVSGIAGGAPATLAILADPNAVAGPDGSIGQTADNLALIPGEFTLYGGVSGLAYVNPANPYTLSGSYSGNSTTSTTITFTYTGDGLSDNLGTAVLA